MVLALVSEDTPLLSVVLLPLPSLPFESQPSLDFLFFLLLCVTEKDKFLSLCLRRMTILLYCSCEIINNIPFHFQNCSGLDGKLYISPPSSGS